MKVVSTDGGVVVRLYDVKNGSGNLFAECPYDLGGNTVQEVIDSSRYFVLRVVNNGQVAYLGLGFNDRDKAFQFKSALFDSNARVKRSSEAKAYFAARREEVGGQSLALKEGEKINVSFKVEKTGAGQVDGIGHDGGEGLSDAAKKSMEVAAQMRETGGAGDDFFSAAPTGGSRRRKRR